MALSDTSLINDANLVAYWTLDNTANDSTANSNTLTLSGSPSYSSSVKKQGTHSLQFVKASSQGAYRADSASLSITGSMSVSAWVYYTALPATDANAGILDKWRQDSTTTNSWVFQLHNASGTTYLNSFITTDGSYQSANDKQVTWSPSTNTWYHVVWVYDSTGPSYKFYVDNSQQGSTQAITGASINDGNEGITVGCHRADASTLSNFSDAYYDDVAVFSRVLTTSDISTIFSSTPSASGYITLL